MNNTNTSSFVIGSASASFIFANLNGTISGWSGMSTAATTQVTTLATSYTGLAINQAQTQLYAASASGISVFNSLFSPISLGGSAFETPGTISALGLVLFNVQGINGNVYVTYAPLGPTAQRNATSGQGAVAIFNESGALQQTIVGGPLAAPWGITVAPASFGQFGGDLLVGNFSFGESEINAFDLLTGIFEGTIPIELRASATRREASGPSVSERADKRKSRHPLLHRRHQRREGWAVWCNQYCTWAHRWCRFSGSDLG